MRGLLVSFLTFSRNHVSKHCNQKKIYFVSERFAGEEVPCVSLASHLSSQHYHLLIATWIFTSRVYLNKSLNLFEPRLSYLNSNNDLWNSFYCCEDQAKRPTLKGFSNCEALHNEWGAPMILNIIPMHLAPLKIKYNQHSYILC